MSNITFVLMKRFHIVLALSLMLIPAALEGKIVDSLYFDARGSFNQEILEGKYTPRFMADHFNFNIYGHISKNITYRVRQRLHVWGDAENPFKATDWLCINWQVTPKLKLYAGKTAALIGGYEYDSPAIDVYFYSRFCSGLDQGYVFGVNMDYNFLPNQSVILQVGNSPLSDGFKKELAYNIAWGGQFAKWWKTIWSVNFVEDTDGRMVNYLALGNHFIFGNVAVDVDFFNRAGMGQKNPLFTDYSIIGKVIWTIRNWNICAKFGYEINDAANVDAEGKAYDRVIEPGTESLYGGCGLEYFPLKNDKLRLHAIYFTDTFTNIHNIQIGITWRFRVIKNTDSNGSN